MRSDWSVEMQSSTMFARPSPFSLCGFAVHRIDRPGGDRLVGLTGCNHYELVHTGYGHSLVTHNAWVGQVTLNISLVFNLGEDSMATWQ